PVGAARAEHELAFGEGAAGDNEFYRPVYVRLDDRREAIRLGPGLIALLGRPRDYYQQRGLFPRQRVARKAGGFDKAEQLKARRVQVQGTADRGTKYHLTRSSPAWQL